MKRFLTALFVFAAMLLEAQISPQFFAMHVEQTQSPWPPTVGVQFSSWRSVSSYVKWSDINLAPDQYHWTLLDQWIETASQNGQSVLYNLYYTPSWASSCPTCKCSQYLALGGCYAPNDLNLDGSGTDQHLKDFVTALLEHVGPGKIKYIEIWNEPNVANEYKGTVQQLVRMSADARAIARQYDPKIQIVCPPETGDGQDSLQMQYLASFLAAGGGQYVDIIALHGYVKNPEDIITRINNTLLVMSKYGQSGKPVFVTEGSWWTATPPFSGPEKPGFTFRQYLSVLSTPVQRFYLFAFDADNEGTLWNPHKQTITATGFAYQLFYSWLEGAMMTTPCKGQSGNAAIWSCTFSRSGGYQAEAIWDTVLPFGQSTNVKVNAQYVQYRDLYGNVYPITNHQVSIGYTPIWLENTKQ